MNNIFINKPYCKNCLNCKNGVYCTLLSEPFMKKDCPFYFTKEDQEQQEIMYAKLPPEQKRLVQEYKYNLLIKKNNHY